MIWLRRRGWTIDKLAERYGISRQRVHQITQGHRLTDPETWPLGR